MSLRISDNTDQIAEAPRLTPSTSAVSTKSERRSKALAGSTERASTLGLITEGHRKEANEAKAASQSGWP